MLLAADDLGQTQKGNNNTYCQDNELGWLHWDLNERQQFLAFVRRVSQIWKEQPVFQRPKFFQGLAIRGSEIKDISWFSSDGQISDEVWARGPHGLGVRLGR